MEYFYMTYDSSFSERIAHLKARIAHLRAQLESDNPTIVNTPLPEVSASNADSLREALLKRKK